MHFTSSSTGCCERQYHRWSTACCRQRRARAQQVHDAFCPSLAAMALSGRRCSAPVCVMLLVCVWWFCLYCSSRLLFSGGKKAACIAKCALVCVSVFNFVKFTLLALRSEVFFREQPLSLAEPVTYHGPATSPTVISWLRHVHIIAPALCDYILDEPWVLVPFFFFFFFF